MDRLRIDKLDNCSAKGGFLLALIDMMMWRLVACWIEDRDGWRFGVSQTPSRWTGFSVLTFLRKNLQLVNCRKQTFYYHFIIKKDGLLRRKL